jgi:hypothetical protein
MPMPRPFEPQEDNLDDYEELTEEGTTERFEGKKQPGNGEDRSNAFAGAGAAPTDTSRQLPPDMAMIHEIRSLAPVFPWDAIPNCLHALIKEGAKAAGCAPDYTCSNLLAASSAAIGNARRASPDRGWYEQPHLWAVMVGFPSHNKSPALRPFADGLKSLHEEWLEIFREDIKKYNVAKLRADAAVKEWKKSGAKDGDPPPECELQEPVLKRIVTDDPTVETLAGIMIHPVNYRGLILVRDELSGWIEGFDRYRQKGSGGDREFYLEAYNGGSKIVDRVKNPIPHYVPYLSMAVVGGIQPGKITGLFQRSVDGLLARFLWIYPDPVPPQMRGGSDIQDIVPTLTKIFKKLSDLRWALTEDGNERPLLMKLDKEGQDILHQMRMRQYEVDRTGRALDIMIEWYGKNPGRLLRVAMMFELLTWVIERPDEEPPVIISGKMMQLATDYLRYCESMLERCLAECGWVQEQRDAVLVARWILGTKSLLFSERDLYRTSGFKHLRDKARRRKALGEMQDAGWIEPIGSRPEQRKCGRPSAYWKVNPAVFTLYAQTH